MREITQHILSLAERYEARLAGARCKTCADYRTVVVGSRYGRCPDCNFDCVEEHGYRYRGGEHDGELIGTKNIAELARDPRVAGLGWRKSALVIGPQGGESKTVWLRHAYNCWLHRLKWIEKLFLFTEMDLYRSLRQKTGLIGRADRAEVLFWDELGTPGHYLATGPQSTEIVDAFYFLADDAHRNGKTVLAASNYDYRKTVRHPGIRRRLSEIFEDRVVTL